MTILLFSVSRFLDFFWPFTFDTAIMRTESSLIFDFFSVRSIFISPNERQKQYFNEPRVKILLLVFMSEIKNDLSLKKSKILFLFA